MSPVNVNAIGAYLREQGEQARTGLRHLAQAAGVSNPNLSQQIAKGLRVSADAMYVQAGILDERPDEVSSPSSVIDAIMADQEISARQKQMLADIYESFRKERRAETAARAVAQAEARAEAEEAGEAVEEAVEESHHDPVVEVVAAAEAEPWTDPPAPRPNR